MSTRTNLRPQKVITNGDMTTTLISAVTVMQSLAGVSYGFSWTGVPVGGLSVQVSDDYALDPDGRTVLNAGTWTTLVLNQGGTPVTSMPVPGSTPPTAFIDVITTMAYAIRCVYTPTSGSGTLNATVTGKVL